MEHNLKTQELICYERIFEARTQREETCESVVPDVLPDVERVLCASGTVIIRSKEAAADSLTVTGGIAASVLYAPEDASGVRALTAALPFTFKLDAPGVTRESIPVARLTLGSIEARLINPRRVLIRATICIHAQCFERGSVNVVTGFASDGCMAETLIETESVSPVVCVQEKTFVIAGEYAAAGITKSTLLAHNAYLRCSDVRSVGSKLIIKGVAVTEAFFTNDAGCVERALFEQEFSQIVETDREFSLPVCRVALALTAEYIEAASLASGERGISAELHIVAQIICADTATVSYMKDCYSNRRELIAYTEEIKIPRAVRMAAFTETLRENIDLPDDVQTVLFAQCRAGEAVVSSGRVSAQVCAAIVYSDSSGALQGISRSFNVFIDVESEAVSAVTECTDVSAVVAANGLELRAAVAFEVYLISPGSFTQISTAELGECCGEKGKLPSVTVLRLREEESLWSIGKRCHSTREAIMSANSLSPGESAVGRVLLVPTVK